MAVQNHCTLEGRLRKVRQTLSLGDDKGGVISQMLIFVDHGGGPSKMGQNGLTYCLNDP